MNSNDLPFVYGILLAGAALRFSGFNTSALWYDEAFSLVIVRQDLFEMVHRLTSNISPPGWEMLLWFVTRLLGYSEWADRIVPLLASITTLWIAYRLTEELQLPPAQQLVALVLFAFLPFQFWMAQEGRIYAIFSLLYATGILWALQGRWVGLTAVMGLMLWCHNIAIFYIATLLLVALLRHPLAWKRIIGAGLGAVLSWLPWFAFAFHQAGGGIPGLPPFNLDHWMNNLLGAFFANALTGGWQLFGFLAVLLSTLVVIGQMLKTWLAWSLHRVHSWKATGWTLRAMDWRKWAQTREGADLKPSAGFFLPLIVLLPLIALILCSLLFQTVFLCRTLLPLIPFWVMWWSPILVFQKPRKRALTLVQAVLPALWVWVMIAGLAGWSPASKGSNLFEMVNVIREEWQPGDIIYHATGITAVLFWHYLPNDNHFLLDEDNVMGRPIVDEVKINVPQAPLEDIPHRRAWIIWEHNEGTYQNVAQVDARMTVYVRNCRLVSRMYYWQNWTTDVYFCDRP